MSFKVDVISKDTINPSYPTPHHLRNFKLSLLDQYAVAVPVPLILFYTDHVTITSDHLKKSLSETLSHFYPLAGRINDNNFIYCSDEGVSFFEGAVNVPLNVVLKNPIPEELAQLLPKDNFFGTDPKPLLSIQATIFNCGGMSLGVCISHKLGDASSISLFLNNWAAITRGDPTIIRPKFDMASLFPPKAVAPFFIPPLEITQKVVSKKFIFEASNIAALRAKSSDSLYVGDPTRVEAVSALIWRCAMKVVRMRLKPVKSSSVVMLLVNLRGKLVPPMTNMSVGNPLIHALATSTMETLPELHCLVGQLSNAISKIDSDYVQNLQVSDGLSASFNSVIEVCQQAAKGELDLYVISSWCRIPFYEVDFGSGKPVWIGSVGSVNFALPNSIMLMDTKDGYGIEAWVGLIEEDMARFECDPELITFTSSNQAA